MKTSRRHERGAVLVEAAVVIPSFIILFGGMLFLHHVIREQLRVGASAKDEAWRQAIASCQGASAGDGLPQIPFTSTMPGAPGAGISLSEDVGNSESSAVSSVAVNENGLFAFSQSVSAHAVVYCNDQTAPGDIDGVIKWLISSAKGLL
ncbi:MAG: hypothetical protein FWD17_01345 [Polyangiaceae bacterium]|nr:hypothetical protein [Polyangiaceae bacterium]